MAAFHTPRSGDFTGRRQREQTPGVWLVLIGALALGIRLFYIFVIARAPVGVGGDAGFYHSAANELAGGHFYYRVIFHHAYKTAEHPPLYSLLLSVVALAGGKSLIAQRVVGCVVGSCLVVAVGVLAGRLGGRRAAIVAALLAALYPPFITADGLEMAEPLFALSVALALLLALSLWDGRGGLWLAIGLGVVIGLSTLTRGEGLALVPLLLWPAALVGRRPGSGVRLLAGTLTVVIVLAPWVIRNYVVFGKLIIATDSNTLIAGANCQDTYYGHDIGWWSNSCLAHGRTRRQLEIGTASTTAAFHYAEHHVARLPLVAAVRVLRTFDLFQPLRQGNREPRVRWVDIVGLVFFYPLLVLAGFGLARIRGRRWPLLTPIVMVIIVSILGWGIGRFRIAADVSIVTLAAVTLASFPATLASGRRRRRRVGPRVA